MCKSSGCYENPLCQTPEISWIDFKGNFFLAKKDKAMSKFGVFAVVLLKLWFFQGHYERGSSINQTIEVCQGEPQLKSAAQVPWLVKHQDYVRVATRFVAWFQASFLREESSYIPPGCYVGIFSTSLCTPWESLWSNQYFIGCKLVGPRHRCEKKGRYPRWSFPCLGIFQDSKNYFRLGSRTFQNAISQHDHCFKVSRLEFTQNTAVEFYPKHQFGPKRSLNLLSASNPIRDRGFLHWVMSLLNFKIGQAFPSSGEPFVCKIMMLFPRLVRR